MNLTQKTKKNFYTALIYIVTVLESDDDYSLYGGKEYAVKRILELHCKTDQLRVLAVNELRVEITSRFNEEQMDVVCDAWDDVDLCPDWLWLTSAVSDFV